MQAKILTHFPEITQSKMHVRLKNIHYLNLNFIRSCALVSHFVSELRVS